MQILWQAQHFVNLGALILASRSYVKLQKPAGP